MYIYLPYYHIWMSRFFNVGGEPALREGAHGDAGVPAWLALPPLGPQSIICAAPEERRLHGNDLEWSSQGLQLRDWWWARGDAAARRFTKGERKDTHTRRRSDAVNGWEVSVSHLTATLWWLSQSSSADVPWRLGALEPWSCPLFSPVKGTVPTPHSLRFWLSSLDHTGLGTQVEENNQDIIFLLQFSNLCIHFNRGANLKKKNAIIWK